MLPKLLLIAAIICLSSPSPAQDSSAALQRIVNFPTRFFDKVNNKTAALEKSLTRQTEKYVQRLLARESRLKKKLARIDSATAKTLFDANPEQQYALLLHKLQTDSGSNSRDLQGAYLPYIDSLKTSLSFLDQHSNLLSGSGVVPAEVQQSLSKLNQLQSKLENADQLKQFVAQRKDQFKRCLSQYTRLPGNIKKLYQDYNKQLYYLNQQLNAYKEMLNDPDAMVKKALAVLNKVPAFSAFVKKHSMLAALFNPGGTAMAGNGPAPSINGFQTRSQVMSVFQQASAQPLPNSYAVLQRSLQSAQSYVDDLRSRANSGSGELDMPNFKPNMQKTKRFWNRLEYGTNLQTVSGSNFFPVTTDLGLSIGYKLNDKNVIGFGVSYKIGWGKDIRHVDITSQGAGLRSFADLNIRKSFYASGGFEYNYQQPFRTLNGLHDLDEWQQSGLVGISKIVSLKSKTLKKTKIQLLWDFLSYQQIPRTPAIKFRVGYSF